MLISEPGAKWLEYRSKRGVVVQMYGAVPQLTLTWPCDGSLALLGMRWPDAGMPSAPGKFMLQHRAYGQTSEAGLNSVGPGRRAALTSRRSGRRRGSR